MSLGQKLQRQDASKWKKIPFDKIKSETTEHNQDAVHRRGLNDDFSVPVEVDVLLLGLDGSGGYGYKIDEVALQKYLTEIYGRQCPFILESGQKLSICHTITYNMLHVQGAIEVVQEKMKEHFVAAPIRQLRVGMGAQQLHFPVYDIEASAIQDLFQEVVFAVMGGGSGSETWHKENVVFVINPDKWAMRPSGMTALERRVETKDFLQQWDSGMLGMEDLMGEEAGFFYRWNYHGKGRGSTWISSSNFVVIDLNSGPADYGPEISSGGAVFPTTIPRIHDILGQSAGIASQLWHYEVEASKRRGDKGDVDATILSEVMRNTGAARDTRMKGQLGGVIGSAVRHIFVPDIQFENIDNSERVLIPVIILKNHDEFDPLEPGKQHSIDVEAIKEVASKLLSQEQEAVFVVGQQYLHDHIQLSMALDKSIVSFSEGVYKNDGHRQVGARIRTNVDSDLLLQEFATATDMLTVLFLDSSNENSQIMQQYHQYLQHFGDTSNKPGFFGQTRVLPIFVLSLVDVPINLAMDNKGLIAANKDAIIVLQTQSRYQTNKISVLPTGHTSDGQPILWDTLQVTDHIIAGLAQSLAGVVAPYQHFNHLKQQVDEEWLWGIGCHPYGPYSNCTEFGAILIGIARRNQIFMKVDIMVKQMRGLLRQINEFGSKYLQSAFGLQVDAMAEEVDETWIDYMEQHPLFIEQQNDLKVSGPFVVRQLHRVEKSLKGLSSQMTHLGFFMYNHDYEKAQKQLQQLTTTVEDLDKEAQSILEEALISMRCCRVTTKLPRPSLLHIMAMVLIGFAIFGVAIVVFVIVYVMTSKK